MCHSALATLQDGDDLLGEQSQALGLVGAEDVPGQDPSGPGGAGREE